MMTLQLKVKFLSLSILALCLLFISVGCTSQREAPNQFLTLTQSDESQKTVLESMQMARIDGIENKSDWIRERDDSLSAIGFLGSTRSLYVDDGVLGAAIFFPKNLDGITLYQVLPIIITGDTLFFQLDLEDVSSEISMIDAVEMHIDPSFEKWQFPFSNQNRLVQVRFSVQDGWTRADEILMFGALAFPSDPPAGISGSRRPVGDIEFADGRYWIDVSKGDYNFISGTVRFNREFMIIPSRLGTTRMYYHVRIDGLEDSNVAPNRRVSIEVGLDERGLFLVDGQ